MYLEVVKNDTMVSETTNQTYIRTTFRAVKDFLPNGRTVFANTTQGSRLYNEDKEPSIGDLIEGKIISFDTTPYTIEGRVVNKTTVVAFSDENPVEVANKALARNNACVVLNGKPTLDLKPVITSNKDEQPAQETKVDAEAEAESK